MLGAYTVKVIAFPSSSFMSELGSQGKPLVNLRYESKCVFDVIFCEWFVIAGQTFGWCIHCTDFQSTCVFIVVLSFRLWWNFWSLHARLCKDAYTLDVNVFSSSSFVSQSSIAGQTFGWCIYNGESQYLCLNILAWYPFDQNNSATVVLSQNVHRLITKHPFQI